MSSTTQEDPMLQLRPNCECCDKDLPPETTDARICSFECTFCADCAQAVLQHRCPNCGGELVARPRRPADKLAKYPASIERKLKQQSCQKIAWTWLFWLLNDSNPSNQTPNDAKLIREAKKRRRRRNFLIYLGFEFVVLIIVIWDDIARSLGR